MRNIVITMGVPLVALMVACSPDNLLENGDDKATNEARETARVETAIYAGTQVGTVAALQSTVDSAPIFATQLAQLERENADLVGTIEAVTTFGAPVQPRFTPTPSLSVAVPTIAEEEPYTDVRTATSIDEATGCPLDKKGRFSETAPIVYFTAIGRRVLEGTIHQVRWLYDGELQYESGEWVADQDYENICIYFWIEPSDVTFHEGLWSADLYVDGDFVIEVPFEFCGAGELC